MSAHQKRLGPDELSHAARLLREVLKAIPPEEDAPRDAKIRRRVEGAIAATELAAVRPATYIRALILGSDAFGASRPARFIGNRYVNSLIRTQSHPWRGRERSP
jgi:hypothetical protein